MKRQEKYDSNEPFQIVQVGLDPETKQFSYRKNKFYTVRIACLSNYLEEIEDLRNQFSKFDLDSNKLEIQYGFGKCTSSITYGKYPTLLDAENVAAQLENIIDKSVAEGPFKIVNYK